MSTDHDIDTFTQSLRTAWSADTSGRPDEWTPDNPALGQCDVSSFVAWEHLGGELVLGQVFRGDEMLEHHYWNRIEGQDVDFTKSQFVGDEVIREVNAMTPEEVSAQRHKIKPELLDRIALLTERVAAA